MRTKGSTAYLDVRCGDFKLLPDEARVPVKRVWLENTGFINILRTSIHEKEHRLPLPSTIEQAPEMEVLTFGK